MLHRSFKPVKCKTSLKLASSRIKLLKNRKDVQVKQMKRELAQLLESGQEQTARIRVEHVIREEKMKSAYELLEIYCELIAVRMQIIESQKNCPIDLKEAIASVIFASPRCSDVVELQDVRKHFTAKYGKEFVSAATEVRPDSGVSRMMVEKLSAKTPDGHEKVKVLREIAEEHDIKWDAKSLEQNELKPHEDLLKGPNTFEKPKIIQPEPTQVQTASSSTFQSPQTFTGAEHHQKTSFKRPSSVGESFSSPHVKNQSLEFEDAVAAAKAAAESAEIACRAASEAAELARQAKLSRQASEEMQKLSDLRNEERRREDIEMKSHGNHSFQVKEEKGNHLADVSGSLRSKASTIDQHSQKNSSAEDHSVKEEKINNLYSTQQSSFIEERIDKQASSDVDDQRSYNHPNLFAADKKNPHLASDFHVERANSSSKEKGEVSDKASVVFDDFPSDDDGDGDGQEHSSFGKKPFVNISSNTTSSAPTEPEKLLPVTFDHSDGPSSDTEDEVSTNTKNIQNPQPAPKKIDDSESLNEFGAWFDKEINFDVEPVKESTNTEKDSPEEPSLDFGSLRGGFRHQKPRPLPYTKNASSSSDDSDSVPPIRKKESLKVSKSEEDQSSQVSTKMDRGGSILSRRTKPTTNSRTEPSPTKIASSRPVAEERLDNSESSSISYNPRQEATPVSFRQSVEPGPSKSLAVETEAQPHNPASIRPKTKQGSTEQIYSKTVVEEKPINSEAKPEKKKPSSSRQQRTEPDQSSSKMAEEKPKKPEARSDRVSSVTSKEKPTSTHQKIKPGQSSSNASERKPETSEVKTSSSEEGLASESSLKKATHVHPKLPDYDDIAARLQALRVNRG